VVIEARETDLKRSSLVAIEEKNASAISSSWCREVALPINRKGHGLVRAERGARPTVALTL
jgi:hypothetical protein